MSRRSTRSWLAVLVVVSLGLASASAEATWGAYPRPPTPVRAGPPDQSWLNDVPERRGARARAKVAVFAFSGDDVYQPVRGAVVHTLRRRHLNVTATLKPAESATEYRELATTLNLALFVEGEVRGEGARQSALIRLYSGLTGHKMASARFSGPTEKIVDEIGRTLWKKLGPTITRACSGASRPRRLEREPLRIDAGTPLEGDAEGT